MCHATNRRVSSTSWHTHQVVVYVVMVRSDPWATVVLGSLSVPGFLRHNGSLLSIGVLQVDGTLLWHGFHCANGSLRFLGFLNSSGFLGRYPRQVLVELHAPRVLGPDIPPRRVVLQEGLLALATSSTFREGTF